MFTSSAACLFALDDFHGKTVHLAKALALGKKSSDLWINETLSAKAVSFLAGKTSTHLPLFFAEQLLCFCGIASTEPLGAQR